MSSHVRNDPEFAVIGIVGFPDAVYVYVCEVGKESGFTRGKDGGGGHNPFVVKSFKFWEESAGTRNRDAVCGDSGSDLFHKYVRTIVENGKSLVTDISMTSLNFYFWAII